MSSRDDMVLRPPAAEIGTPAQKEARRARAAARIASRRSVVGVAMRRRLEVGAARKAAAAPKPPGGGAVALAAGGALVATMVALRLLSGRSFENMGQEVERVLLGDTGAEVLAKRSVRDLMQANGDVMAFAAAGGITKQMREVGDHLYQLNLKEQQGRAMFLRDPEFQVNGQLDMVILRMRDLLIQAWNACGGPQAVDDLEYAFLRLITGGFYK